MVFQLGRFNAEDLLYAFERIFVQQASSWKFWTAKPDQWRSRILVGNVCGKIAKALSFCTLALRFSVTFKTVPWGSWWPNIPLLVFLQSVFSVLHILNMSQQNVENFLGLTALTLRQNIKKRASWDITSQTSQRAGVLDGFGRLIDGGQLLSKPIRLWMIDAIICR